MRFNSKYDLAVQLFKIMERHHKQGISQAKTNQEITACTKKATELTDRFVKEQKVK